MTGQCSTARRRTGRESIFPLACRCWVSHALGWRREDAREVGLEDRRNGARASCAREVAHVALALTLTLTLSTASARVSSYMIHVIDPTPA